MLCDMVQTMSESAFALSRGDMTWNFPVSFQVVTTLDGYGEESMIYPYSHACNASTPCAESGKLQLSTTCVQICSFLPVP